MISSPRQKASWWQLFKKQRVLQAMVLLGIAWMLVFNYLPMLGISIAFFNFDLAKPLSQMEFVGLKHFREFLGDPRFWRSFKNTIGISFWKLLIGFPLPIIFALLLNEIRNIRFKRTIQTISYLPHFLSWAIFGGLLMAWLSERNLFNTIFIGLGLQARQINYISKPEYYWQIAVISDVIKEMGWNAIIYIAAISAINPELYEAAVIDGANRYQKMWYITVQSIRPTIAILFILAVSNVLGSNFDQVFVLRNSMNLAASETIDMYVYTMGLTSARYSYSTAVSLARSVISLVLLLSANFITGRLTGDSML